MKRIFVFLMSAIAIVATLSSCNQEYVPDGTAELQSIKLTSSLNPSLDSDIVGAIDAEAKTITFVIPESVSETSFIPTFTVTTDDIFSHTAQGIPPAGSGECAAPRLLQSSKAV